jgi:peroxiredoxin Q/BCP
MLAAAGLGIAALAATFVLLGRGQQPSAPTATQIGTPAPAFGERDVVTGNTISSESLRGKNVLLFFSEGVMCQACFEQIQALEARAADLKQRGLVLVNVTTDRAADARQAAQTYRITTPLVADENRDMSGAYDVLGQGMHPNTAGHTFILVDGKGVIRWRRDYGLGSDPTMYVKPDRLLADIPKL